MSRARTAFIVALALAAGAGSAHGQSQGSAVLLGLQERNADTVFGAVSGGEFVVVVGGVDYLGRGIASFSLTLHFDPSRVSFVSASAMCPDSATYPLTATPFAAGVRLLAGGCASFTTYGTVQLARVRLRLSEGATSGSVLYVRADSLTDRLSYNRLLDVRDATTEVCHASGTWGDVDGDNVVNSRDALIALTHAVGLPVGAFDVSRGDVDADGFVSSRDALFMLTASIGGYVGGSRTGRPLIDRCAPDVALGRTLYFVRGNTNPGAIAYGSGLSFRNAGDTSFVLVGDSADSNAPSAWRPRVSPDGLSVLFVCYSNPGQGYRSYNICRANADGSNPRVLTSGYSDFSPDWSPDGTRIVFLRNAQIAVMDSSGANQILIPSAPSNVTSVAWQPVASSNRIAYTTNDYKVWTRSVDTAGTEVLLQTMPATTYALGSIEWSPGGDSLAFDVRYYSYPWDTRVTWVAPATAGFTPRPRFALSASSFNTTSPVWTDLGQLFSYYDPSVSRYRLFFLRSDGAPFRLMRRDARDHYLPGMRRQ